MDEGLNRAVKRHFVQLYNEGLIYRGKRIINWCPRCQTALSDIETEHETKQASLWHIKYGPVVVATTRPETMLGDTAIAVNPKDERYKHLWGTSVELPLVGRKIPIIKDEFVDPAFGTGAVKVTPAHDPNDYEMGIRHNLPSINILTPDGKITGSGIAELDGLDRFKAREAIVKLLEEKGFLVKIEDYETSIAHCYRCKTIIEPYLSDQWFVKVGPLAKEAIAAVEEGKIKFVPERWSKVYLQWMTNLRDWCISRQLWWGHQIPAWYRGAELYVGEEPPKGEGWTQDPDVFDTWFSSALWPFSTLGWPDQTEELKTFYPTDVLVTSYDIIFFWVARMIMAGLHFTGQVPFHTVYFNALVKDIHGKKMSKSWGNVIDPLAVIEKAGADALRFAFLSLIAGQGQDVKLSEEKITQARNFANKIWNASRFILVNLDGKIELTLPADPDLTDKWILAKLNETIKIVSDGIEHYDFGLAAHKIYDFIWGDYCDWYIELSKNDLYSEDKQKKEQKLKVLVYVLEKTLRLLHPFMPFITEEIWSTNFEKTIMLAKWPKVERIDDQESVAAVEYLKALITAIRNIKANYSIQTKDVDLVIQPGKKEKQALIDGQKYIKQLAKVANIKIVDSLEEVPKQSAALVILDSQGYVPLKGLIDLEKELERLRKEEQNTRQAIERLKQLLANKEFTAKAPPETIAKQEIQKKELAEKLKIISLRILELS
jgi:valyl-tRNA synthetase